jgi:glycosyltransferase involved in cell wall biosynthesis
VPAYNEMVALPATLKELTETHPEFGVVVVDDGSTDETTEVARQHGAVAIRLPFNLGVGGAVRTGLHYALDQGADRVVLLDADGQHDPAGVDMLLGALDDGADLAIGSRFADGADAFRVGQLRRMAMRFLQSVVKTTTGLRLTDVTSGFRAANRPVIALLASMYPAEYLADTVETILITHYAGFEVREVPVAMRPRAGGEASTRHLKLVLNYLRLLIGILSSAYRQSRPHKGDRA